MFSKQNVVGLAILWAVLASSLGYGEGAPGGNLGGGEGMRKPLEVKGQTRAVNMLMVMQAQKDKINFIGPRKNYRKQIQSLHY